MSPAGNRITEFTRRDLFDAIIVGEISWAGDLEEVEFLSRLYDLDGLPSLDPRFSNAARDIWQHRVNNWDWDDYWVFDDRRFKLISAPDEELLRFLAETVHPAVRRKGEEAEAIVALYNGILIQDGFEIAVQRRISGKAVYAGRSIGVSTAPGITSAQQAFGGADLVYVAQQIERIERSIHNDPGLAIGTAKELVETCCKTILSERGVVFSKNQDVSSLVKVTVKELKLTPDDIPDSAKAATLIKRMLSQLAAVAGGLAELRNKYGTGHGKEAKYRGLSSRHAKLAVGAASTLSVFLVETHSEREPTDASDQGLK